MPPVWASFCPFFLTHCTCGICSPYTWMQEKVEEKVINIFYFSEKGWINEYISIPESASFAYKEIKHMLTTVVPSFQKFVLTYVVLVINFLAAILVNCMTLPRWLCLLKMQSFVGNLIGVLCILRAHKGAFRADFSWGVALCIVSAGMEGITAEWNAASSPSETNEKWCACFKQQCCIMSSLKPCIILTVISDLFV